MCASVLFVVRCYIVVSVCFVSLVFAISTLHNHNSNWQKAFTICLFPIFICRQIFSSFGCYFTLLAFAIAKRFIPNFSSQNFKKTEKQKNARQSYKQKAIFENMSKENCSQLKKYHSTYTRSERASSVIWRVNCAVNKTNQKKRKSYEMKNFLIATENNTQNRKT